MSPAVIVIVSDLVTLVLTLGITLISIGIKWGHITADMTQLQKDVAEIKGMFVLKLRELR